MEARGIGAQQGRRRASATRVESWRLAGCVLVAVVAAACAGPAPEPPVPPGLAGMDPDLARHLETVTAAVRSAPRDATRWLELGHAYQGNYLYPEALDCYERVVQLAPRDSRGWYHLAHMRERVGNVEGGIEALGRLAAVEPYLPAHWQRGFWLLDLGRLDEAEASFREATRLAPADPAAWVGLARLRLLRGDPAEAVRILERLIAGRDQPYYHHLLGTAYRQLARSETETETELLLGRASVPAWNDPWRDDPAPHRKGLEPQLEEINRALADGRLDVALPALELLRSQKPEHRDVLSRLGRAYLQAGRSEAGIDLLEENVRRHPHDFRAELDLATAYEMVGDYGRALEHADRALAINPTYAYGHRRRGSILRRQQRLEEAAASLERAVGLAFDDADALVALGDCRIDLGEWGAAVDSLERATRYAPTNAHAFLRLGVARMGLDDHAGAEAALRRAISLGGRAAAQASAELQRLQQLRGGR